MKKPSIRNCDECRHFRPDYAVVCALTHRPRFIMPNATLRGLEGGRWDWQRRCEDFMNRTEDK